MAFIFLCDLGEAQLLMVYGDLIFENYKVGPDTI